MNQQRAVVRTHQSISEIAGLVGKPLSEIDKVFAVRVNANELPGPAVQAEANLTPTPKLKFH
jgi:hypothetical protein